MPPAPSTDGGHGGAGNREGGRPHPAEAVPGEGGPGGTSEQGVEGLLEVLSGRGKRATGVGGRGREGGESVGPSGSPLTEGYCDPGTGNLLVKERERGAGEILGSDRGSLTNPEKLGERQVGKTNDSALHRAGG